MKVKIWTVTTEGDNAPIETVVFADEAKAIEYIRECVKSCDESADISALDATALCERWAELADGPCLFDEHTLFIPTEKESSP
jgi:hypothetical protein